MIEVRTRDPQTGQYSDSRFWSPMDEHGAEPHALCEALLEDAMGADGSGHGVEIIAEVGGLVLRMGMGPTPYPEADGTDRVVWCDVALGVLRSAREFERWLDSLK